MKSTKTTNQKQSFSGRKAVFRLFRDRCLLHPEHKGVVIHEIEPRSQRPNNWWEFENQVLLCNECHSMIHNDGAAVWKDELTNLRREWVKKYA